MKIQSIFGPDGAEMVVMARADYDDLVARAQEMAGPDAGPEARLRVEDRTLPAKVVGYLSYGFTPLEAWRTYRGMTQRQLQQLSGIPYAGIVRLESMGAQAAPAMRADTRRRLASVLKCPEWALDPAGAPLLADDPHINES